LSRPGLGSPRTLFAGQPLDVFLRDKQNQVRSFVAELDPDLVLSTPLRDLAERVFEKWEQRCPVLRPEDRYTPGAKDTKVDVSGDPMRVTPRRSGPIYVSGTEIALHVPFDGDAGVFSMQPSFLSANPPRAEVRGTELVLTAVSPADTLNTETMKRQLEGQLQQVTQTLAAARGQTEAFNSQVRNGLPDLLQQRHEKILRDRELEAFLAVPVTRRSEPAKILTVSVPR
jgi:hypothetical protein